MDLLRCPRSGGALGGICFRGSGCRASHTTICGGQSVNLGLRPRRRTGYLVQFRRGALGPVRLYLDTELGDVCHGFSFSENVRYRPAVSIGG